MTRQAFTLVELSIVLVILGLLVGGVLSGQSLIRAAELRAVVTERDQYVTATHAFKDKYFALPGDMTNATAFWTEAPDCADVEAAHVGTATCNGNGDGQIDLGLTESVNYWQQLANAGLIAGTYSGAYTSGEFGTLVLGTDVPKSKLGSAGWSVTSPPPLGGRGGVTSGIVMLFGATQSGDDFMLLTSVLKPEEAYNIDRKTDDGHPLRGGVRGIEYDGDCINPAQDGYELSNTATACALLFNRAF